MQTDKILWHTLSKNTIDPEDNLCKVDFTMSRETEANLALFGEASDSIMDRIKKAVAERGYDFVNIDWSRKVLYVRKM